MAIISKLESIDFRSWILTTKLCYDEDYNYQETKWFIFGKNNFSKIDWKEEILRFKLNNKSTTEALKEFVSNILV